MFTTSTTIYFSNQFIQCIQYLCQSFLFIKASVSATYQYNLAYIPIIFYVLSVIYLFRFNIGFFLIYSLCGLMQNYIVTFPNSYTSPPSSNVFKTKKFFFHFNQNSFFYLFYFIVNYYASYQPTSSIFFSRIKFKL